MTKKNKICIILGTRPELVKLSPVIRECQKTKQNYFVIHTGQHYSYEMDEIFFKELNLPKPKYNLSVGSQSHGAQTGRMLIEIEKILNEERPDVVLVQGDTNSVMAGALVASKMHISVGHIEAGLRSYDRNMPEEINRVITDHISDYLFSPTNLAKKNLEREGIEKGKIYVVGNTIVDSVLQNVKFSKSKSKILKNLKLAKNNFILLTVHRAENTDQKSVLSDILKAVANVAEKYKLPIVWPMHPRTKSRIANFSLEKKLLTPDKIKIIDPVGFMDFLQLEDNAFVVLTDSGGVQEETCILKVPCVTLRDNTERPETIDVEANILVGTKPKNILEGVDRMLKLRRKWENPFGDGKSGKRIIDIIKKSI